MTRVLRDYPLRVFGHISLFQQAIFPFRFRFQVGWITQECSLQFFLAVPGISHRVARRTYAYLGLRSKANPAYARARQKHEQELRHAEKVIKTIKEEGFWDGRIHNSKTHQS